MTNLLAIVLMGVILLTSSGFKLYSHSCSHKNVSNYSIILPAKPCYTPKETSCCGMEIPRDCDSECTSSCCNDEQQFARYEIESFTSLISDDINPVEIDVFNATQPKLNLVWSTIDSNVEWHLVSEPPPPVPVNKFLSFIQVYLN